MSDVFVSHPEYIEVHQSSLDTITGKIDSILSTSSLTTLLTLNYGECAVTQPGIIGQKAAREATKLGSDSRLIMGELVQGCVSELALKVFICKSLVVLDTLDPTATQQHPTYTDVAKTAGTYALTALEHGLFTASGDRDLLVTKKVDVIYEDIHITDYVAHWTGKYLDETFGIMKCNDKFVNLAWMVGMPNDDSEEVSIESLAEGMELTIKSELQLPDETKLAEIICALE